MTSNETGAPDADLRHLTADMIQYLAKQRGVDFFHQDPAKLGFLTALIASMARVEELPPRDRSLHAASVFELARTTLLDDDTAYATGWNLGIDLQMLVMDAHAKAGALSPTSLNVLRGASAQLSLVPPSSEPA